MIFSSRKKVVSEQLIGRFFPAGDNSSINAVLRKNGQLVTIELVGSDGRYARKITGNLKEISRRLGHVPRKITFVDLSMFETDDNDGVDRLIDIEHGFVKQLARVEGSFVLVTILLVLTVLALANIYQYGLPLMAKGAARITPVHVLTTIDKGAMAGIDGGEMGPSTLDKSRQMEVAELFGELARESGQLHPPLNLIFRDGLDIGPNAMALPGGTIIVTDQMIKAAQTDDELAGVLAHEIGHVQRRHTARQIYRALGVGFMVSIIAGDSGQMIEDVVAKVVALESLSYSRSFEAESDYRSAEIMVALGRDPLAVINLLNRLTQSEGGDIDEEFYGETDWLATHPGMKDREKTVRDYLAGLESKK